MKNLIALALMVAILGTALVGCGGTATPTTKPASTEKKPDDKKGGATPS